MIRHEMPERPGYLDIVERDGLAYAVDRGETGSVTPYWHEEHAYEFTDDQINELERVTAELHHMCIEAARHLISTPRLATTLGLSDAALRLAYHSLQTETDQTLYGRFDLAWDGESPPKLLEYNADTPAALHETAVTQWTWLDALRPGNDQWNMLPELLTKTWARMFPLAPGGLVHLAFGQDEPSEDWVTVAYLADTARAAGLNPELIAMEGIGWDAGSRSFVDLQNRPIRLIFKMYPWEWMLDEPFGQHLLTGEATSTHWIEPVWKTLLGSKTILAALWEIYPDHPNLLPTTIGEPGPWPGGYVAKPVYGWEGAGIQVVTPEIRHIQPAKDTNGQAFIYQAFHRIPSFGGAHPVLGTWVVGGRPAGLGIRETDGPVTDTGARFVPHFMSTPRSTDEQVQTWLTDPA